MITYSNGAVAHRVRVERCICSSCGSTHAIMPGMLIPFGSYSLFFVLAVLRAYFSRSLSGETVAQICSKHQIAVSTLYDWKKCFASHKSLWLGAARSLAALDLEFLAEARTCPGLLSGFFLRFGFSFMQNRKTPNSGVP
ncbi:MAG: helix-turn-helix domain containing protein [Clostridiales bacterium]|nr:helix-turn-helix domain containing protein [Clostridiales bacterium]